MGALCFTVPGEVRGKGRPRFGRGRTYTDAKTLSYENLIGWTASQAMGTADPFEGPLCLNVTARFAPPASASRKAKDLMLAGAVKPAKRPDFDNIAKAVADALNGVAWADDAQVVTAMVRKVYAATAGLDVVVRPDESVEALAPQGGDA